MRITYAILADAAEQLPNGNLNLFGVFDTISASRFPATHRLLTIVARLEGSFAEEGDHRFNLQFVDGNGSELRANLSLFRCLPVEPGRRPGETFVMEVPDLHLPEPDDYEFRLWVDDELLASIPLIVTRREAPPMK